VALFVTSDLIEIGLESSLDMAKRKSPEQIVTLLRQIEVAMGQGKSAQIACREAGIRRVFSPVSSKQNPPMVSIERRSLNVTKSTSL
jgi:hypothetical protein